MTRQNSALFFTTRCLLLALLACATSTQISRPHHVTGRTTMSLDTMSLDRRSMISTTAAALVLHGPRAAEAADAPNAIPAWQLDNGVAFPLLALNTAGLSLEGSATATRLALEAGITNIDFHPGQERDGVARALASLSPTLASQAFLTTKIGSYPGISPEDAAKSCRRQIDADLQALGRERVDMLMLRDSPDCAVMQAQWKALESAVKAGKARSIGVVNYCEAALGCVLDVCTIPPALNYFMLHAVRWLLLLLLL